MKCIILGGGISGLSVAHYIRTCGIRCKILLLEASNRMGGHIEASETPTKALFMSGPRTMRTGNLAAVEAIKLLEELNLEKYIIPYKKSEASVMQKYLKINSQLVIANKALLKDAAFGFPLGMWSLAWREVNAPLCKASDESVHSFVARRCGPAMADVIADAMIRGIYAGDARRISVRSAFTLWHGYERKYGSVIRGAGLHMVRNRMLLMHHSAGSRTCLQSSNEHWNAFGLMGGLTTLVDGLLQSNDSAGVEMRLDAAAISVDRNAGRLVVRTVADDYPADYVVCALPANRASTVLRHLSPALGRELARIPFASVAVVNLEFPHQKLPVEGFGYLVPSSERDSKVLGVIFDSCQYPATDTTVLTVLMGGAWFEEHFGSSPSEDELLTVALQEVSSTLGLTEDPIHFRVIVLKDCIPQYEVGHHDKLVNLHDISLREGLPIVLSGNSYNGVGVPDTISDAKDAAQQLKKMTR